ncbi:mitochondrial PGP phosphatase-domain-containing protein [Limtongia smithiae]|uniref:mitochondrial PGP phosphatase-domain-containing protein n=1 Tax=Limtongia smithiae TaxID=1125753 RepID=UPI0034CD3768
MAACAASDRGRSPKTHRRRHHHFALTMPVNLPAALATFSALTRPTRLLPALSLATFGDVPVPIVIPGRDIRAVVLDKDNCFAAADALEVHAAYAAKFAALREAYPGNRLLIVSNSAGCYGDTAQAEILEAATGGVPVLRHTRPKPDPACAQDILDFFLKDPSTGVTKSEHVVVVGDRLLTDVVMANTMGAAAVWLHTGVQKSTSIPVRFEQALLSAFTSTGILK